MHYTYKYVRDKKQSPPSNRSLKPRAGVEVQLYSFFNLGARWGVDGQRHAQAALPPGKRAGTHRIGGWVGHRVGPNECGKSRHHWDTIPGPYSAY
jgi:hypothetical protein